MEVCFNMVEPFDPTSLEGRDPLECGGVGREISKIAEYTIECPYCGNPSFRVEEYVYEIPVFGRILLSVGSCSLCGFKRRDVGVLEEKGPKKLVLRVRGERELRYLLVKSARAAVLVPEVALEYTPTLYSYGYITTVEGILYEFQQAALVACSGEQSQQCKDILAWLEKAVNGEIEFTVIICDYDGLSKIVGEGVIEVGLDEECRALTGYST
ncbi:MAG: ZPR1 zinc finger domain-containing protein [Desulfurococcaceae archaeon]|jgi:zinc finger protein|nr:ZPR1 zinc finger domain-containing protein [Desulfurococcaceae archaeon]